MTRLALVSLLLVAASVAAGCGFGSGGDSGSPDVAEIPTATLPAATPEAIIVGQVTAVPSGRTYTVQAGDSPGTIAELFGTTSGAIMEANGITDPTALFVGQVLTIPGVDDDFVIAPTDEPPPATDEPEATAEPEPTLDGNVYIVQEGDIPETIAAQFGITTEELMEANGITDPTSLNIGDELIIPAPSGE